jgi:hypothetical protein
VFCFNDTRSLRRAIAEFLGDPIDEAGEPRTDAAKSHPPTEATQGIFRREGEFWTIACRGEVFRLRDVRGLAYIAFLLGHPGEEVHVLSLASKAENEADEASESATALERIAGHSPALAALLTSSIRTGTFCSYTPDARLPASWRH